MAMERFELSEGWKWKPLRSVVLSKEIWSPAKKPRESFKYIEISSVDNKTGTIIKTKRIDGKNPPSRAKKIVRGNDIIFGTTRPYLKNISLIPEHLDNQICSTGFCVLRADIEQVIPEWIFLASRSDIVIDQVIPGQDKSAYPAVSDDEVLDALIPLPPIDEQRRIVARIEKLTKRVEEARKLRRKAIADVEKYLATAVAKFFEGREGNGWETKKVKEICEYPQYGYTESANLSRVGPKFLRITDIQDGKVDWNSVPYCECDEVEKYRLKTDDIVFARTGATTGKSFIVKEPPEAVFASYLIRLRAGRPILPEFLAWYFQSSLYWRAVSSGIEDGNRPNMNGTKLANLKVPFPEDKLEQQRIVSYLDSLRSKVDELKRLQGETEAELEKFTHALLAKAFRGEL